MTAPGASYALTLPREVRFGRGAAAGAAGEVAARARRVCLVHGRDGGRARWLVDALAGEGVAVATVSCSGEPDLAMVEAAVERVRQAGAEAVVALGGGAAIDLAKAAAALAPGPRPAIDHLEVVGDGLPLEASPLPVVALPTTAGTGAEVTRNAVIGVPEHGRKVSLRDPRMVPDLAIVDPALTDGTPRAITLASGLDALTQVIEPYLSARANPTTDALCRAAIPLGAHALVRAVEAEDQAARDAMAQTSLWGGLALANAGLGAVHGLAGVLGGRTGAPHGALCGVLLPHVLATNRAALADRAAGDPLLARFDEVESWLSDALPGASGDCAIVRLIAWSRRAGLPSLAALGLEAGMVDEIVIAAAGSSSIKANPVALPAKSLRAILDAAA